MCIVIIIYSMKHSYVIQPYWVGTKTKQSRYKSVAMVIPRDVVEHYHINTSTVFLLKTSYDQRNIVLHIIDNIEHFNNIGTQEKKLPADESFPASKQQASLEVQ
jgi:hypothetical protein